MLAAVSLLAVGTAAGNTPDPDPALAQGYVSGPVLERPKPETLTFNGVVLVGVDAHGRVLAALDESRDGRRDGRGDRYYLFRNVDPYPGSWFRLLRHATLVESDEGLVIYTQDRRFALALSLETGTARLPPGAWRESRQLSGGVELTVATPNEDGAGTDLSELDFRDLGGWPEAFRPASR